MAGGIFLRHDKVRPGAYINFKGVSKPTSKLGTRGVLTMPVPLAWGDKITELYSTDLIDGKSLEKIGYTAFDEESQIFREALKHCYKAIIFRLDKGGTKATLTISPLVATAKFAGKVGNEIALTIVENGENFDVITLFRGIEKNRQTVKNVEQLQDNEWLVFSGNGQVVANAGANLTGGTNGTVSNSNYTEYMNTVRGLHWDTMAIPQDTQAMNNNFITYIRDLRDNVGTKVQIVLYNAEADHEAVITTCEGYKTKFETVAPTTFVAYMGGLTAGSGFDKSNTYHVIDGAIAIVYPDNVNPYDNKEIEKRLQNGKIVLTERRDGAIIIEKDINTLHTFTQEKGYDFSKNRIIRTLDEVANSINLLHAKSYIGKVDNDKDGLNVFKSDIIAYFTALELADGITNFNSKTDIELELGIDKDVVIAKVAIQPIDSMEKLYMTILVR